MKKPDELAELSSVLELHRRNESDRGKRRRNVEELERKFTPKILARDPAAVREIAMARAELSITQDAIENLVGSARDLALRCVPYGYKLERALRDTQRQNHGIIHAGISERVGQFYTQETMAMIVGWATPALVESTLTASGPTCSLGGPSDAELHPNITPEQVIENIARLEAALAAATERTAVLRRQFN